jgi:hypothetical protein
MIRLKEPGERGGYMTVEMTPFDALSLLEGLTAAIFVLEDKITENEGKKLIQQMYEPKLKDARANYKEISMALQRRNDIIDGKEVVV